MNTEHTEKYHRAHSTAPEAAGKLAQVTSDK